MRAALAFYLLVAAAAIALLSALAAFGIGDGARSADGPGFLKGRAVLAAGFEGGDFSLSDLDGRRVSAADFGERHLLLTFGVPDSDLSSLALELVDRTLACLGGDAGRLQPVFVSLQPDETRDLARYLAAFDPRIAGLSGTGAEIRDLARRYRVRHDPGATAAPRDGDHSAFLYLIAPRGRARSYYPPSVPAADLCADLRAIVQR